jgi:aminodeoxyfutalosine synthase
VSVTIPLEEIAAKVRAGEPLTDADVRALESGRDIISLGMMADTVRRNLHGRQTTYVRVLDVKLEEIGSSVVPPTAGEVRIFETPSTLDAAVKAAIRAREASGDVPLSAFCLFELSKFAEPLPVTLAALKNSGLELLAQAPYDKLGSAEHALEAVKDAGMQVARLTINDTPSREWTAVCGDIAALQRRLQSVKVFAPLARATDATQPTTGYADVKRVAIARVMIQDVSTIQVDWTLYGPKLAQVALTFGADDVDSVPALDDDSRGTRRSPLEEIRRGIVAAGFDPVERDARFVSR